MKTPCRYCNKRYVGCHAVCELYLEAHEEREAIKKAMKDDVDVLGVERTKAARAVIIKKKQRGRGGV